jgi:hypothetical protein
VNPKTIEYQVMRHVRDIGLRVVTQLHERVDQIAGTERGDIETDELVMISAWQSCNDWIGTGGAQLRHKSALRRCDASGNFSAP